MRYTPTTSIAPSGDAEAKSSTRSATTEKGSDLLMRQLAKCQSLVASDEEMAAQVATGAANLDVAVNRWVLTILKSGKTTTSVAASMLES
jgi:hypothetical protein